MKLDLDASLERLAAWLTRARQSEWSPEPERKALYDLARSLDKSVEALRPLREPLPAYRWAELEDAIDAEHPGRFASLWSDASELAERLREFADRAREQEDALPNTRAKPELRHAADVFLCLWREAGRDPALTGTEVIPPNEAVVAFGNVLRAAGIHLSVDRIRKMLSEALARHDPHYIDWLDVAVWAD